MGGCFVLPILKTAGYVGNLSAVNPSAGDLDSSASLFIVLIVAFMIMQVALLIENFALRKYSPIPLASKMHLF